MIPLVLRRLAGLLILTLILPLFTLLILRLIPGDFCRATLPETASLANYQQCQRQLPSLGESYYHTLSRLAQGDLGNSLQGHHRPVATDLATHLPSTVWLGSLSCLFGLIVGTTSGLLVAHWRHRWPGHLINLMGITLLATPIFILAVLLRALFVFQFRWLQILEELKTWQSLLLPVLAIGLPLAALFMRNTRNAVLLELQQDYIRTARAKGVPDWRLFVHHAWRNAGQTLIPLTGLVLVSLLDGTLLVELIFNRPGLGRYTFEAVISQDYPALQGVILLIALLTVTGNLLTDLLYHHLFPQSR